MSARVHLIPSLAILCAFSSAQALEAPVAAAAFDEPPQPAEVTDAAKHSIQKGLDWLVKQQNPDGSWGCWKADRPSVSVTSIACLALMSMGDTPNRGKYSEQINKAVTWLLKLSEQRRGEMIGDENKTGLGPTFAHGMGTLFLAEVYGMTQREDVKEKLERAVKWICERQNPDGGWGDGGNSDLPITATMYMALRSSRGAGIEVPSKPFEKFEKYVLSCQNEDGGFSQFQNQHGRSMLYPSTAGLRLLYGLGKAGTKECDAATQFVLKRGLGEDYGNRISEWCFLGSFYVDSALMIENGPAWKAYFPKTRDYLVKIQNADGSWTIQYCSECRAFASALAVCTLAAPYRALPVYQL